MTCIFRSPLLDSTQKVLGYQLGWQRAAGCAPLREPDLRTLAATIARRPDAAASSAIGGDGLLFLRAAAGPLTPDSLAGMATAKTVISLAAAELAVPTVLAAAATLREQGFGLSVRGLPSPEVPEELHALITHVEFDWGEAARARALPVSMASSERRLIATGLANREEYQASVALGVDALLGDIRHASAAPAAGARRLSPESLLILQLMQMVQANVDVRHLESTLKRDAAVTYQLLRYLNSASFGFGVEVQSLRHAVALMGYGPLYRWLAVLLTQSTAHPPPPALMQAAVIRGRFVELLGQGLLPQREAENLFVTGMFSLLDGLLGVPITEVLDKIQLPEAVVQALLTREGLYGPFLRLVEACESVDGGGAVLAEAAFLTSAQTNSAHVAALAWVLNLRT